MATSTPIPGPSPTDNVTGLPDDPTRHRIGLPTWLPFLGRRLGRLLISVWVLVTFSFLIIHLVPGDPIRASVGAQAPAAVVDARREALGLDDPLLNQYGSYLRHLVQGDLGASFQSRLPVRDIISARLPATLSLAFTAFAAAVLVALPLGLAAAVRTHGGRRRRTELAFTSSTTVVASVPDFLAAIILVFAFAVSLAWLPIAGNVGALAYVIPVTALALGPAAGLSRIVRVETVGVLGADYVRTARAKRLSPWRVYVRHALPNAMTATLTVSGLVLSGLVAGTVLVEKVVSWPGLGPTLTGAIINKDYPLAQGIVLVYGGLVLAINLVVDLLLVAVDPRSTLRKD